MGMSIDSAVTKWAKEVKTFFKPNKVSEFHMPEKEEDRDEYYAHLNAFEHEGGLTYYRKFDDAHFNERYYEVYAKSTKRFLEWVKAAPEGELKTWLLEETSKLDSEKIMIHSDYDRFIISDGMVEYQKNMWVPKEFAHLNEDGKLLEMATSNLSNLYGVSLSSVMISRDELDSYDENDEYAKYLDDKIQWDTEDLAKIMEFALKTIKPKPNDEYFDGRMERLALILDALKKGAKFIYSV